MSTKNHDTKLQFSTQCATLSKGIAALPDATFPLDGANVPKASLTGPLDAYVAAEAEVTSAEAAYTAAVQKAHAARAAAQEVVGTLKPYLKSRFGGQNPILESQFGVPTTRPRKLKVAVKAEAAQKGQATRKANKPGAKPAAAPQAATPSGSGAKAGS